MITSSIAIETTKAMTNQTTFPTTTSITSTTSTTTTSTTIALTTTAAESNSSVLILNTANSNVPLLTDINGNIKSINFEIENDVYVHMSCGVQFKGDYYVYGSYSGDERQIAKVTNCSLKRIGNLSFNLYAGACTATMDQVFLCFDLNSDYKTCHAANEPTGQFNVIAKSAYNHDHTRIATNNGQFLDLVKNT